MDIEIHGVLRACILTQIFLIYVYAQYDYSCNGFCSKTVSSCPENDCPEGSRLMKNATQCGCCHICIKQLSEGESCKTKELAVIPREECGDQLKCDKQNSICVPVDTKCVKEKTMYDENLKNGWSLSDKSRPNCDEYGFYEPVTCVSDVLCYCVNKTGERIFGTDIASNRDAMNCNCSIDFDNFPRRAEVQSGDFLRCLSNGNYDPLQCTEKWCYCMGDSFHAVGTKVKANTSLNDLLCYDKQRHKEDDALLRSKCWRERNILQKQKEEYENKGITVIGVDLPKCDLDGSFAPKQCKKNSCYCVKRNGELYEGLNYEVKRSSIIAKEMTCRCIREKEMLSEHKDKNMVKSFFEKYPCDSIGNYKNMY